MLPHPNGVQRSQQRVFGCTCITGLECRPALPIDDRHQPITELELAAAVGVSQRISIFLTAAIDSRGIDKGSSEVLLLTDAIAIDNSFGAVELKGLGIRVVFEQLIAFRDIDVKAFCAFGGVDDVVINELPPTPDQVGEGAVIAQALGLIGDGIADLASTRALAASRCTFAIAVVGISQTQLNTAGSGIAFALAVVAFAVVARVQVIDDQVNLFVFPLVAFWAFLRGDQKRSCLFQCLPRHHLF